MRKDSVVFRPLATKLATPGYTQHALPRPRLEFPEDFNLVGIVAPPGYGKSTLMAQWRMRLERQGVLCAWLSLDEEENDVADFFRYLVHAMQRVAPEACREAMRTLKAGSLKDPKPIWRSVVHFLGKSRKSHALFLDDFHKITNPEALSFGEWMLRHLPANFRVVLASRPKLWLKLHRLKSYGGIRFLEAEDLRFSLEETADYLNSFHRFGLGAKELRNAYENSEGWILALQMISILARKDEGFSKALRDFSGRHEEIGNYLAEVVLESVDTELREAMEKISVFDRFSAEFLDDVLATSGSNRQLRRMRESNLFLISLDEEGRWFRFHHLFGDFLRENLRREHPGLEASLQRGASRWFRSRGFSSEAIEYALRAGDFEGAAESIAEYAAQVVENRGDTATFIQWMSRLPAEYKIKHPMLGLYLIGSHYIGHNFKKVEEEVKFFRGSLEKALRERRLGEDDFRRFQEILNFLKVDTEIFDMKIQKFHDEVWEGLAQWPELEFQKIALKMCVGGVSPYTHEYGLARRHLGEAVQKCRETQNTYLHAWTSALLLLASVRGGGLPSAMEEGAACLATVRENLGSEAYVSHMLAFHYAEALAAQGKIAEAWEHLTMPPHYLESWGIHGNLLAYLTTRVRLSALRGDYGEALRHAQYGRKLGKKRGHRFLVTNFQCLEIEVHLLRQDFSSAKKIFEGLEESWIASTEDRFLASCQRDLQFLSKVKLALYQKQAWQLLPKLQAYVAELKKTERVRDHLAGLVLQAAAQHQSGQGNAAVTTLVEAVAVAAPEEYVLPFAEQRQYLGDFFSAGLKGFQEKYPNKMNADYRRRLISLVENEAEASQVKPLSPREREVLAVLESGKDNRELARQLGISEATLKWHLHRLFRKFSVKNRTGLIVRVKEVGLLEF